MNDVPFCKFRDKNFRDGGKSAFSREILSRLKENEGKNFKQFRLNSHGDNLQGFMAKRVKIEMTTEQQRKNCRNEKKLGEKSFRKSRILCNFASKKFRKFCI